MFTKIIVAAVTILITVASGITASIAANATSSARSETYEMATYKWDPETKSNVFVGYRKIRR